ncbi:hypothetical protein ACFL54_01020 [Planctomycetota bacterium]
MKLRILIITLLALALLLSCGNMMAQDNKLELGFGVKNTTALAKHASPGLAFELQGKNAKFPDKTMLHATCLYQYPAIYLKDKQGVIDLEEVGAKNFKTDTSKYDYNLQIRKFARLAPAPGYYQMELRFSRKQRPKVRELLPTINDKFKKFCEIQLIQVGRKSAVFQAMPTEIKTARDMVAEFEDIHRQFRDYYIPYYEKNKDMPDSEHAHPNDCQKETMEVLKKHPDLAAQIRNMKNNCVMKELFMLITTAFEDLRKCISNPGDQVHDHKKMPDPQKVDFGIYLAGANTDLSKAIALNLDFYLADMLNVMGTRYEQYAKGSNHGKMEFEEECRQIISLSTELLNDFKRNYHNDFIKRIQNLLSQSSDDFADSNSRRGVVTAYLGVLPKLQQDLQTLFKEFQAVQQLWMKYANNPTTQVKSELAKKTQDLQKVRDNISRHLRISG